MASLHIRLRDARRAKGWSQSALATEVGCKQSAISMMEGGRADALAQDKLQAIATLLSVSLDPEPVASSGLALPVLKICPVAECPSNMPYVAGGQLHFLPLPVRAPTNEATRCGFCGEILESACPQCKALLRPGACCTACGSAYVPPLSEEPPDRTAWADRQRERVIQIRSLMPRDA